jgi:putative Mg2+ transporter-C (MgtC) family protein
VNTIFDLFQHQLLAGVYSTILLEIFGALLLGLLVGYERSYRGRAAGMRTYGFVCMAACAMTTISGYPELWFGSQTMTGPVDPTRIIQGIITGIGFLGAGVIMRDGLSISGLTTAASIWAVAAVGILMGVGFYLPAIFLAALLMIVMMWGSKIEVLFPAHHAVTATLHFNQNYLPDESVMRQIFLAQGYKIARGSFATGVTAGVHEWRFVLVSMGREKSASLVKLSQVLSTTDNIQSCHFSHTRN